MIHHGDAVEVMSSMGSASVDAIVTDPPYGLEFMGKGWDKLGAVSGGAAITAVGLTDGPRLPRPAYSGSPNPNCRNCGGSQRGNDRKGFTRCRCENPDFPNHGAKQGAAMQSWHARWAEAAYRVAKPSAYLLAFGGTRTVHRMTVALEDAGWIIRDMLVWAYASGFPKSKASLKPAWEPIVMARKPGPLRMLAIDACRIPTDDSYAYPNGPGGSHFNLQGERLTPVESNPLGRWPANVILTDPIFDGGVDGVVGGGEARAAGDYPSDATPFATFHATQGALYGDSGTYSRFFLVPKSSRSDREPRWSPATSDTGGGASVGGSVPLLGEPVEVGTHFDTSSTGSGPRPSRANQHPTVKPTDLMRHLVRLVTPAGGTVLDPFLGSGTTGLACELEGFPWIGIEKEAEYVAIAEARLNGTQRGLGLVG